MLTLYNLAILIIQYKDTLTCPQEHMTLQNSKNEKLEWGDGGAYQYLSTGEWMCGFYKMDHY